MKTDEELAAELAKERYRTLKIWNDAIDFAAEIYRHTAQFPVDERFGLVAQLRRAGVSVPSNIAEGSRRLPAENINFLRYALGSLAECDTQLTIAERNGIAEYPVALKASIMSLTAAIRAFAKAIRA